MQIGYILSSEEHGPRRLVDAARVAEQAGFESVSISDHFHPWLDDQGESPFVWSVIGALAATTRMRVMTGVTCPTVRIHPAVIAQAAATSAAMMPGRFRLGVGTGENLNEHILGDAWPPVRVRLEMLEEAVQVMRMLWSGDIVTHHGAHYTVHNARLYTLPDDPPPVVVSAFGPKSIEVAARIGDGLVVTAPQREPLEDYRDRGGRGPAIANMKLCWAESEAQGLETAHHYWRHTAVPGQLSQELPLPEHFEQVSEMVKPEMMADQFSCGPDPEKHLQHIRAYRDAGYDELYISQIGPDQEGFLRFWEKELRPALHDMEVEGKPQRQPAPGGRRR